jgi:hypothetical protein
MKDLQQVITDWRGDAAVLKSRGHMSEAKLLETCADEAAAAAEDYLRFLSEPDAQLRSSRSKDWLRSQFPQWEQNGNAKKISGRRYYRMLVVPQRANLSAAREEGRRVGMKRSA